MRVLYLLTRDLDATGRALRAEHERDNEVETLDLRVERDCGRVVDLVAAADRVVCW
jgi:hypothetical protein